MFTEYDLVKQTFEIRFFPAILDRHLPIFTLHLLCFCFFSISLTKNTFQILKYGHFALLQN